MHRHQQQICCKAMKIKELRARLESKNAVQKERGISETNGILLSLIVKTKTAPIAVRAHWEVVALCRNIIRCCQIVCR